MTKPILPTELSKITNHIPDFVISSVNYLLVMKKVRTNNWETNGIKINQEELVDYICQTYNKDRFELFYHDRLNFEALYREAGYDIEYHQDDIDWSADEPNWIFKIKQD